MYYSGQTITETSKNPAPHKGTRLISRVTTLIPAAFIHCRKCIMKPCIILKNISPAGTHLPITCAIRRDLLFARQTILYFTMFLRGIIFQKTLAKKFWNARYSGNFSRAAPMGTSILYRNLGKLSASDFPSLADNKGLLSSSQPFQNLKHILMGFSAFVKWVFSKEGKLYHFVYALSNLVHGHFFIKPL